MTRVAHLVTHPIQYHAPLYRRISAEPDEAGGEAGPSLRARGCGWSENCRWFYQKTCLCVVSNEFCLPKMRQFCMGSRVWFDWRYRRTCAVCYRPGLVECGASSSDSVFTQNLIAVTVKKKSPARGEFAD